MYDYVLQYQRWLKTEHRKVIRYVDVQVVLLFTLSLAYQSFWFEVVLKYEDGDILESS